MGSVNKLIIVVFISESKTDTWNHTMTKNLFLLLLYIISTSTSADLKVNGLFTNNMVLQRNKEVLVYGTAENEKIVTVEFNGQKVATQVHDGSWQVTLKPMDAGGPFDMIISGEDEINLKNILVGDVWVLGGQSNMARPTKTYTYLMENLKTYKMPENLRWLKMDPNHTSNKPTKKVIIDKYFNDSWQQSSHDLMKQFSPAGYFFAMERMKVTGVPIGLIMACRGATKAQCWVPGTVLESRKDYAYIID